MNTLILKPNSTLYHSLYKKYYLKYRLDTQYTTVDWPDFLKELDDNILFAVRYQAESTINIKLTFKDKISKTFFILKYS